ncbi:MAG: nucleotidyltransferase domain-containing protein [Elusimicrobiota bacterium]
MDYSSSLLFPFGRSKARAALLGLFFTSSEQEYFPRQLERVLGISVGNLQKELLRFERVGLLKSRRLGQLKLYRLDSRHPLFPELEGLVAKTVGVQGLIRRRLERVKEVEAACIYGSFAAGEAGPASDVDVLILGDVEEQPLLRVARELEARLGREINYLRYSPAEWRRRGKAGDPFITEVLKRPRISLIGGPDAFEWAHSAAHRGRVPEGAPQGPRPGQKAARARKARYRDG